MKKAEKIHMDKVAQLGCIICSDFLGAEDSPAELHHLREGQGQSQRSSNYEVIPLCPAHHRLGGEGVAFHASPDQFRSLYGTETELLTKVLERI